ncbi:flavin-containing monooxygenase FMO GS-OX-like 9 [Rhodamnia argentea]|uniref:Flavin-containing monooxygenase n=1 Tax=Rhodamnia argentea TaxID=178133 RepID=A0A8B8PAW4_9MYRT|nr:flavin-containing monooxygenase FMO GS-OX-like 9 [Rhodamnia argentea]
MVSEKPAVQSKHVCVIGAGPSGLVAARELRKEGHSVVVLEQSHDIGGQWLYEPNVEGEDPLGRDPFLKVHSSMYESLRLLSPREIMGYSDFPFLVKKDRDTRRFPGHRELLLYLQDFAEWFGLRELIRFNTRVEHVAMADYSEFGTDLRWVVKSKEIITKGDDEKMVEEVFDAVVVATGHYAHPRMPSIKGMATWKRKQFHSHVYRVPEPFRDEVVVVVGNSYSGQDISMELAGVAREVHLSSKSPDITEGLSKVLDKHRNLCLRPQIDSLNEDGTVSFLDGSFVIADTILYCTGYSYAFPFLDTKGIVVVDDDRVGPLYEHTFPPSLAPSLSFIGIPRKIIGFPFFESQAKWIAQLLSGKRTLPTWNEMMQSIKDFYNSIDGAGLPKHNTHDIANFEYCEKYGDNAEFPHLEEWRKVLCLSTVKNIAVNLETFRDSWDEGDEKLLQEAFQSPHFTQLGSQVLTFQSQPERC